MVWRWVAAVSGWGGRAPLRLWLRRRGDRPLGAALVPLAACAGPPPPAAALLGLVEEGIEVVRVLPIEAAHILTFPGSILTALSLTQGRLLPVVGLHVRQNVRTS